MILEERGRLTHVDSRVKILWLLATLVAGLAFISPIALSLILASIIVVALAGGVLGDTVNRMKGLVTIILVIGLILGLTVPGEPLFYLIPPVVPLIGGSLPISLEGLQLGLVSSLRILVFAAPILIVTMTTNNSDLIRGLMWYRLPPDYALMITLALNFVPVYIGELERIADAQKARAHSLVDQGFIGRMRGMVPIFVPLTLNAVDRADTIGKVLEMRGFARRELRLDFDRLNGASWVLLLGSLLLLLAALATMVTGRDWLTFWLPGGS